VPQNDNTVCESAVDEKVHCFTAKSETLQQTFGTSEVSINKLLRRVGTIKNANQWESFVVTLGGINAGHRANAIIRFQANHYESQDRWSDTGIQVFSQCGRPALGTKRASKRPRNLANAIGRKQPNAKSHGSGH
jgi:hypothetical protein